MYGGRLKSRFVKYSDQNVSNYQGPDYSIY